jgi:predicted HicB family RNase H-like nuclease
MFIAKGVVNMEDKKSPRYVRGKYSEGQKEATIKYLKNNYDELRGIRVPKGKKDVIKAHAEKKGLSLNAYINELIAADMGDDLMLTERKK